MNKNVLAEIFKQIQCVTSIEDVAYHEIVDGKLRPILKTNTNKLSNEEWIAVHTANPVYVANEMTITEILSTKTTIAISDVANDPRSSKEFFAFGINSIMIIPHLEDYAVKGLVIVASIHQNHTFTDEEVEACSKIVKDRLNNKK